MPFRRHRQLSILLLLAAACSAPRTPTEPAAAPLRRRAILVSFDALNERRAMSTLPAGSIPALRALFEQGACADYAIPAWPSKTSASHASLWTGAWGDVNGIAANSQPPLPRDRHAITEWVSGYAAAQLRAEPIWVTAALGGRRVVGHHPTQAPGVPGFPSVASGDSAEMSAARNRARRALADPGAIVLNGYNHRVERDLAITAATAPPRPALGWRNLERLGGTVPPREIVWLAGDDSVFALLYGRGVYRQVLVAASRDVVGSVTAIATPVERAAIAERPLARHFSEPLALTVGGGRVHLRIRVFALAPDASSFLIFQPALSVVESNHDTRAAAYAEAIGGWVGNGAQNLLYDGALGPTLQEGGAGEAELRYLESLELVTRQFMRGSEWGWSQDPDLMLDYFPVADEVDHMWFGYVAPEAPDYEPELARAIQSMRVRAWELVDRRLSGLQRLVEGNTAAALWMSGDHGMRATWRVFRPNVALAEAGLLALNDSGRVDLSRTSAYSPDGLYVMINTTDWMHGIVPPDSVPGIVAAAERAVRTVRGSDGLPVVTRTWTVLGADTLGRGGPVGGALYYETGAGYAWTRALMGAAAGPGRIGADHGFPSISSDMHTVFCGMSPSLPPGRIGPARTTDVAPTVSYWLGMPAPRDARGASLLDRMDGPAGRQ